MADTSPSVAQLFTELDRLGKEGSYAKAQKIANKILQENPKDVDAFHCKVVCLVQQSCFREAIEVINSGTKKGIEKELPFEKAYCLYRLNKADDALNVLNGIPEHGQREKELMAQVYYRLEDYDKCMAIYKDLIKNSEDDYEDERETNLAAVIAAASQWGKTKLSESGLREDTYELCYNAACLSLANSEYDTAKTKLTQAEALCRKSLDDDPETTEEDVDAELGVLRAQLGYAHQMQGVNDEAMKLYNQVLKSKPNDIALVAVASNNVITLNRERDLFDSKKKIKATMVDGLQNKLTEQQNQKLKFNQCLLMLYSNQLDACRSLITTLEKAYPDCDFPCLMRASLLYKEKQYEKANKMLKEYAEKHPSTSTSVKLTLVQMHLSQGNFEGACSVLSSIKELCHRPGIVSALVTLHTHRGNIDGAISVLDSAIQFAQENKGALTQTEIISLMRENVAYKLSHGRAKEAVQMLEKLHREDPRNVKTLAQLITAYSQVNPKEAEKYSEKLPALDGVTDVDVDSLEVSPGMRFGRQKRTADDMTNQESSDVLMRRKRRKKKKGKLPKNYNAEVDPDPERWLPKRERSYYKGKRQKKVAVGKGTQGSAVTGSESPKAPGSPNPKLSSPPGTPGGSSTASSNVVPPRQQQPQAAKKKQRPKKKKGGW